MHLWRHRARLRPDQDRERLGVSLQRYRDLLAGKVTDGPEILLHGMDPWEHYFILRVRAGWGLSVLARKLGCSTRFLLSMERGERSLKRLIEFWGH